MADYDQDAVDAAVAILQPQIDVLKDRPVVPMIPDKYVMHYPGDIVVTFVRQDP